MALVAVACVAMGASQAFADCGGDGQRACCGITGEGAACASGVTEVNGCTGDCFCGTFLGIDVYANSHCVQAMHCGDEGERACCGGELIDGKSCASGLIALSGCTGNCLCGGSANPLGDSSSTHCFKPSHCGGDGERACCAGTFEYATGTVAGVCESGKVPVFGCTGDCQCGGATATESVNSLETCISVTQCGGENERGCCLSERVNACDDGLENIPGCTGDCWCKGGTSSTTCLKLDGGKLKTISQPGTNRSTAPTEPRVCGLRGYADIHLHMFSDTAHGGGTIGGSAWDSVGDDVNTALRPDYGTHRDLVSNTEADLPTPSCPPWIRDCGSNLFHGDHTLKDDPVGIGTGDGPETNLGAPNFTGWPTWHTTTHQQVYYKWLERAYQGGLRLVSMLAVTNEALCRGNYHTRGVDCSDSMAAIDVQLDNAIAFEKFIDDQNGGAGHGWFHIVRSPAEARQTIADGKLAVVLGIEVDNLFNCHWGNRNDTVGNCSPEGIVERVNHYYDKGVRHVFPIHNFNNAYGGPATWQDAIDVGNRVSEGHWYSPVSPTDGTSGIVDCSSEGYSFKLSCFMQAVIQLLGYPASVLPLDDPIPCYSTAGATCNTIGLTSRGMTLVNALMDKGMIIDVDHMSVRALDDTLALAAARTPTYPVVASHVQFFDLNFPAQRHERMRTRAQLDAIRDGGGMIAAMLKDDGQDGLGGKGKRSNLDYISPGGHVLDDCRHSTETFAQAYQYAVDVMGRPVAFGSDFNGIAGHIGPRFGPDGCGSVLSEWVGEYRRGNKLAYPFDLADEGEPGFGVFGKQVTGGKTFDFNVDGLAHVGLLPDMVADLKQVGLPQSYLDEMFGSAEEYIRVWERASGIASGTGISGGTPVAHCEPRTVDADATCQATASVAPAADQANPNLTLAQDPAGPYGLGTTSVTLDVGSPLSCATDSCTGDVTVVDKTGPSITCPASPSPAECAGATTPVSFGGPQATDNCGAATLDGCAPASGSGFALGATKVTCSAHDGAQNASSCETTVAVVDTKAPAVTCPAAMTLECTGSRSAAATFSASASDTCAGPLTPSCLPLSGSAFPLGTTSLGCHATDPSSNTGSCTSSVTVRDTQPPTISCPAPRVLECTGNNGSRATVSATGSDVCWGTLSPACSNSGTNAFYPLGTTPIQCSESDGSGLGAQCQTSVQVVDTTRPQVTSGVVTSLMNNPSGPNHTMVTVGFTASAIDTCNGSRPVTVKVYANEDDETPTGPGDGIFSPDALSIAPGTLRLRYERVGSGKGRVYLIVSTSTDASGNLAASCSTVAVPVSQTSSSIQAVTNMAATVRAACIAGNGTVPAGYFVVGDGAVIGTKQ
jgi:microsomal dipeptidase-like Zn-dependent dipeptidase